MRRYAYYIMPTSKLSVTEAEARLAEHNRARDTSMDAAVVTSNELAADGVYFDTMGTREDPLADANLVAADFEAGAKAAGTVVRFVTVP